VRERGAHSTFEASEPKGQSRRARRGLWGRGIASKTSFTQLSLAARCALSNGWVKLVFKARDGWVKLARCAQVLSNGEPVALDGKKLYVIFDTGTTGLTLTRQL